MGYEPGTLIQSLAGHDSGQYFIIIHDGQEYVSLVDGKARTVHKPKKKSKKHIKVIDHCCQNQWQVLMKMTVTDCQIRRLIRCYQTDAQKGQS